MNFLSPTYVRARQGEGRKRLLRALQLRDGAARTRIAAMRYVSP